MSPDQTPAISSILERLRPAFESWPDGLLVISEGGDIIDANATASKILDSPLDELRGRRVQEFAPPDADGDALWDELCEAGTREAAMSMTRDDGTVIDVEWAASPGVSPGRSLVLLRDVTDRNRTAREASFRAELLDHVEASVVAIDPRGSITHWNKAAERLYGWSREDVLGKPVGNVVVPVEAVETAAEVWATVRRGHSWEGITKIRRRSGDPLSVWNLNAPIRDASGALAGYVGIAVDITERLAVRRRLEQSEALKTTILASSLDAVVAIDGEARMIEFSESAERMFGYSRDEVIGKDVFETLAEETIGAQLRDALALYHETGHAWPLGERVELIGRRADGTEFPIEMSTTVARLDDGSPVFTAFIRDISARKRQEALFALRAGQQAAIAELGQRALSAQDLPSALQEAVVTVARVLDIDNVTVLERVAGDEELHVRVATGVDFDRLIAGGATVPPGTFAHAALESGEPMIVDDVENHERARAAIPGVKSVAHAVIPGGDAGSWGVLSALSRDERRFTADDLHFLRSVANVVASAIQRDRVDAAIRHAALHDALTGLPNRALFAERLAAAIDEADRRRQAVAVIYADLDRFKLVNDSLGHAAGDGLLIEVADRLAGALRPEDTLARFSGDEFVFLCEDVRDEQDAATIAERLAHGFDEPFKLGERDQYVSVSMGIALPRRRGQPAEELIRDASAAMYQAKERGRGRYELYDEQARVRTLARIRTENDLRHAVERAQLEVHYQPIVSLREGDLAGFEALLRWTHPRRGDVPPAEFIPIAEASGLIGEIGSWALRQAAAQVAAWRGRGGRAGWPLMVGVNLSARQFAQGGLEDEIALVLQEAGLGPDELAVEITESLLMEETHAAVDTLQALKALGVRLILDDFGTGYSSLSYLERFPLDGLKIDRTFVAGLDGGGSSPIVTAIVSMANSLGLAVTAEGVETEDQLDQLRSLGVDYAQGYYFGRPGPATAQAELLGTNLGPGGAGERGVMDAG